MLSYRFATVHDVPVIQQFIRELAEYERLAHEVNATDEQLQATLFGSRPAAEVVFAEVNGNPVGFALFFPNYSTFLAKPGIYLEDLFVQPHARGKGIGKGLMAEVARIAVERECGRFEWAVLDWNEPALEFYRALGAEPMHQWTVQRLTGEALLNLARKSIPS